MTYYLDELKPGMCESFTKTVLERDVELFGDASGDLNPLHFDERFARALSGSYLSAVLGMKIPGPGTIVVSLATRFKAPVRIGDTVVATCTVREVIPGKRRAIVDCVCKVGDVTVVEGEAEVIPPKRPKG